MIGIYKITNKLNNKIYIGQSIDILKRIKDHFYNYKDIRHHHGVIDLEIRAYGFENFTWEVLSECSKNQLNEREIFLIQLYDSTNPEIGYNIKHGGSPLDCGQSKKVIDVDSNEIFDSTCECARLLNLSQGDVVRVCNHLHHTIAGRRLMYLDEFNECGYQNISRVSNGMKKCVYCVELDTTYESAHEAARLLDLNYRLISSVCLGIRKTHGGYHFYYVTDKFND